MKPFLNFKSVETQIDSFAFYLPIFCNLNIFKTSNIVYNIDL